MSAGPNAEDDPEAEDGPRGEDGPSGGDRPVDPGDRDGAGDPDEGSGAAAADRSALADLREDLEALREEVESFETEVDDRTVHRSAVEDDLRRYVRRRLRRGHARGWGPYLVLLYGTAMTIGAFVYLSGGWAILAMLVVWLSTLGLYVLMMLVGGVLALSALPRRAVDRVRGR